MYYILMIIIAIIGWLASNNLKKKARKYSRIPLENGMDGKGIAEKMLYDHGIYDVQVVISDGVLTDHYDPINKTISLSKDVYRGKNIFSAAVAAHETGHAVQHMTAYTPLSMRSALIPAVNFSSRWVQWIVLLAFLLMGSGFRVGVPILLAGIGLFSVTTFFSFISLPVEINASMRALAWITRSKIVTHSVDRNSAEAALRAASYTYVVAALSSLATLLYYIMIYTRRRE